MTAALALGACHGSGGKPANPAGGQNGEGAEKPPLATVTVTGTEASAGPTTTTGAQGVTVVVQQPQTTVTQTVAGPPVQAPARPAAAGAAGSDAWGPYDDVMGRELASGVSIEPGTGMHCTYYDSKAWSFDTADQTHVYKTQLILASLNYHPSANGVYDNQTKREIARFQQRHGLPASGLAGPSFWECARRISGVDGFFIPPDYGSLTSPPG